MNSMVADTLTWKSPKEDANEYSSVIVVNWMSEYSALRHISPLLLPGTQVEHSHVLETAEARDERCAPFFDDLDNTADVRRVARERCRHRRLRLRQRQANIGRLQSSTVVRAVTTHEDGVSEGLKAFYDLVLLVGRHARIDLRFDKHLRQIAEYAVRPEAVMGLTRCIVSRGAWLMIQRKTSPVTARV